jgi:hypothetical protein
MTESLSTNSDGSMAIENLSGASFSKILSGKTVPVGPGLKKFRHAKIHSRAGAGDGVTGHSGCRRLNAFAASGDASRKEVTISGDHAASVRDGALLGVTRSEVQRIRENRADASRAMNARAG